MATDHDAELARFLAGEPVAIDRTLQTLPRSANLSRAVEVVLRMIAEPHWLAACGKLPAPLVRAVLAAKATHPFHIFLQLAVPAEAKAAVLKAAWHEAIEALCLLADRTHPLDTDDRRLQLSAIALRPEALQAVQGVAANTPNSTLPIEMLIVLAIEGSDESVDALIPHIDLALGSRDARLERLAILRPFLRSTPALMTLFAELDDALRVRRSTSPALAFAAALGMGELSLFHFSFLLRSTTKAFSDPPRVQGSVRIDSREDRWFAVEVSTVEPGADRSGDLATRFDDRGVIEDALGLGGCDPAELPAWLKRTARKLKVRWDKIFVVGNVDNPNAIRDWALGK